MIHTDHLDHQRLPRDRRPDPATVAELVAVRRPLWSWLDWALLTLWRLLPYTAIIALVVWTTLVLHGSAVGRVEAEAGPLVVHTADGCGVVREVGR